MCIIQDKIITVHGPKNTINIQISDISNMNVHIKFQQHGHHERQVYIQWTQLMHTSKCGITYK